MKANTIDALTGLRGYAALWVVVSHVSFTDTLSRAVGGHLYWGMAEGVLRHEYLAVDIFFVLSGFVLTHAHAHEMDGGLSGRSYVRFLLLRLARVYPLHLLALLAMLALTDSVVRPTNTPQAFALQLGLMASWGFCPGVSWNDPAWSLSSEWLAYLVLPLMMLVSARLRPVAAIAALAFVLTVFAWVFFSFVLGWRYSSGATLDYSNGVGATTRVIVGVAVGTLLRRLYDVPKVRALPWTWLFWLALPVALPCMIDREGHRLHNNLSVYLVSVFIVFAAACASGRGMWPLSARLPVYLGKISYAIYIFHYPVLRALGLVVGPHLEARAAESRAFAEVAFVGAVLLVVAVAALAHHAVEEPLRQRARRWISARAAVAVVRPITGS